MISSVPAYEKSNRALCSLAKSFRIGSSSLFSGQQRIWRYRSSFAEVFVLGSWLHPVSVNRIARSNSKEMRLFMLFIFPLCDCQFFSGGDYIRENIFCQEKDSGLVEIQDHEEHH